MRPNLAHAESHHAISEIDHLIIAEVRPECNARSKVTVTVTPEWRKGGEDRGHRCHGHGHGHGLCNSWGAWESVADAYAAIRPWNLAFCHMAAPRGPRKQPSAAPGGSCGLACVSASRHTFFKGPQLREINSNA
jgi:hypothetical protein